MQKKPLLICIVGPTAIGKTSLSIKVANHFSCDIISADSRQFYKEMTIGTAVPTKEELKLVKHHFIQEKSIHEPYTVGDFETESIKKLNELFKENSKAVMVGGSGLYIDAVVKGLDEFPLVQQRIRNRLNNDFQEKGIEYLQNRLKEKDPNYYNKVDLRNHHRIIRALEVCESQNKPYSSFLKSEHKSREFETIYIGLEADREVVYDRINKRVNQMISDGLFEEAKDLFINKKLNALKTVGYREIFDFMEGIITKKQAIEDIKKNTRRFAKRQGTWFRKNKNINWFKYNTNTREIFKLIENFQTMP
ncbi:MAG: tRNA (adenosine(37)-N6)-dimethylallyltransferase MiaA [Flavobacteriales bacterium]|nr:MAG: tRNA (adenosine(37)-N6)-dimethylallyltransferase MiaA [Flavobacteriales bacterium]